MDQETKLTYEEKKKLKEEQKEGARAASGRQKLAKRFTKIFISIAIVGLLGYGIYAFIKKNIPEGEDLSRTIPIMESRAHIPVGSGHEVYNSNPPTSGPHYEQTARSGFREDIVLDEHIIHNLEHGDVWVAYHPRVSEEIKNGLKQFAAAKVIIVPRAANETDIALSAWGRLDTFNIESGVFPEQRIRDFINRYTNKGPEKFPGVSGGV